MCVVIYVKICNNKNERKRGYQFERVRRGLKWYPNHILIKRFSNPSMYYVPINLSASFGATYLSKWPTQPRGIMLRLVIFQCCLGIICIGIACGTEKDSAHWNRAFEERTRWVTFYQTPLSLWYKQPIE